MSAEIAKYADGILSARISGKLSHVELFGLQHAASDFIKQVGKVRLLVKVENFQGWDRGWDWADLSFQLGHDPHIERMAIVGDSRWLEPVLLFTAKGFRKFPIEYYEPDELAKARAWLAEPTK